VSVPRSHRRGSIAMARILPIEYIVHVIGYEPVVLKEEFIMSEDRIVRTGGDAGGAAAGAASLIQVIVMSIVVLVLLAVGLYALHIYLHMF
jgi:hypothetical protein